MWRSDLTPRFCHWSPCLRLLPAICADFVAISDWLNHELGWCLKLKNSQEIQIIKCKVQIDSLREQTMSGRIEDATAVLMGWPSSHIPEFNKKRLLSRGSRSVFMELLTEEEQVRKEHKQRHHLPSLQLSCQSSNWDCGWAHYDKQGEQEMFYQPLLNTNKKHVENLKWAFTIQPWNSKTSGPITWTK